MMLTKSKFKTGYDCPRKLWYADRPEIYFNANANNDFLEALAEGGFQVGELAKAYYPGGVDLAEFKDKQESLEKTADLLQHDNVIIFEAAFCFNGLFIRADIVEKKGNKLRLIEVKAKSFNPETDSFLKRKGGLESAWAPYLNDAAFQYYVISKAHPDLEVVPYLMLADKSAVGVESGLNQKFKIVAVESGSGAMKKVRKSARQILPLTALEQEKRILVEVRVDKIVEGIFDGSLSEEVDFEKKMNEMAAAYNAGEKLAPRISKDCGSCEFRVKAGQNAGGLKSGFAECISEIPRWKEVSPDAPLVFDIAAFRGKEKALADGILLMKDVPDDMLNERQLLQVHKVRDADASADVKKGELRAAFASWKFPLHFIDFETSMVALPFFKGQRPYEQIAFQFSHHILREDGSISHAGQFLNTDVGCFPNFEFVRELKRQLERDEGTIFRYAEHENTVLKQIHEQLSRSKETDRDGLMAFIETITKWDDTVGARSMVDLCKIVKTCYYDPQTNGSNGLKAVLPAIMHSSEFLRKKYSKPIYGIDCEIRSLNFKKPWTWIRFDKTGRVKDPYKLLPPVFENAEEWPESLTGIQNGGYALIAYARMQFEEMPAAEREKLREALLRYCELDTLAMVMLYEGLRGFAERA